MKLIYRQSLVVLVTILTPLLGFAESNPTQQTQDLIKNRGSREAYIKGDSKAAAVDAQVNQLAGSKEKSDKIYDISADIFGKVANENGNDSAKIQEALQKAQKDPKAFLNSLTPEQRQKIEALAKELGGK